MNNYVPYISREVLYACYQSTIEDGYDDELIGRLIKDNPSLYNFLQDVSESPLFNEDFIEGFLKGVTMTLQIINNQLECNAMNESIKL